MTPQAMPDAPAPMPVLSSTRTSSPEPRPRASSSLARCHAVESPWTPAPITTNLALSGTVIRGFPPPWRGTRRTACPAGSAMVVQRMKPDGVSSTTHSTVAPSALQARDLRVRVVDPQVDVHGRLVRRDARDALDHEARPGVARRRPQDDVRIALVQAVVPERRLPERHDRVRVDGVDRRPRRTRSSGRLDDVAILRPPRGLGDERAPDPEHGLVRRATPRAAPIARRGRTRSRPASRSPRPHRAVPTRRRGSPPPGPTRLDGDSCRRRRAARGGSRGANPPRCRSGASDARGARARRGSPPPARAIRPTSPRGDRRRLPGTRRGRRTGVPPNATLRT